MVTVYVNFIPNWSDMGIGIYTRLPAYGGGWLGGEVVFQQVNFPHENSYCYLFANLIFLLKIETIRAPVQ